MLPEKQVPRLRKLAGVRDVLSSSAYGPQLDSTPQQIGASALWGAGLSTAGQGVKIGIIDSGVDHTHAFLDPAGYTMPAGFPKGQTQFTSAKVIVARVFAPPTAKTQGARLPFDGLESSHGTHVAGIAAGNPGTRAEGATLSGIAPRAYIGNYKALVRTDSGLSPNGNSPELVAAIEAAVRDGMDVINLSLGEPEIEPSRDVVALALDAAARAGVVPVVAAGNDHNDTGAGSINSPANSARAITVGAVDIAGASRRLADFSSVGPSTMSLRLKPDVAAPGVDVFSSVPGGWGGLSGTSMASPHVAGAAALLVQRHPAWTVAQVKSALVQTGLNARGAGGASVGPSFQGGGVVSLTAADRPLLFAEPASLSFGLLAKRGVVRSRSIRLRDAGGGEGTWTASLERLTAPKGASLVLGASRVSVPGQLRYRVRIAPGTRDGNLSGYITLRRGAEVRRVPFWGRVTTRNLARHKLLTLRSAGRDAGDHGRATRPRHALPVSGESERPRRDDEPARPGARLSVRRQAAHRELRRRRHQPRVGRGAARRRRHRREPPHGLRRAADSSQPVQRRLPAARAGGGRPRAAAAASTRSCSTAPRVPVPGGSRSGSG